MDSSIEKLHLYYQDKAVLPTYAQFSSKEELDKYENSRISFFVNKLNLPLQIFKHAKVIEFGPDSGENSLVFARWGAQLTLVEPNPNSWPRIMTYFNQFDLKDNLRSLIKTDLEGFSSDERYQFIDAEGFIYTVKPESVWIDLFNKILEKDGFFLISYCEAFGSLWELILRLIYSRAKTMAHDNSSGVAWELFETKWNSIPHTRSFASWTMDVLENPFVSLKYIFYARSLCKQLHKAGFRLYSSWPNYIDYSKVYWHKKELSLATILENNLDFIARNALSFAFGKKLFICSDLPEVIKQINTILNRLVVLVDQSIADFNKFHLEIAEECIKSIRDFLQTKDILVDLKQDKVESLQSLDSMMRLFKILTNGDLKSLINFCNNDDVFVTTWGMPAHFTVFQKTKGAN